MWIWCVSGPHYLSAIVFLGPPHVPASVRRTMTCGRKLLNLACCSNPRQVEVSGVVHCLRTAGNSFLCMQVLSHAGIACPDGASLGSLDGAGSSSCFLDVYLRLRGGGGDGGSTGAESRASYLEMYATKKPSKARLALCHAVVAWTSRSSAECPTRPSPCSLFQHEHSKPTCSSCTISAPKMGDGAVSCPTTGERRR